MNHWLENSKKNLIPLSEASEFSKALAEWSFTGVVLDYDGEEIICQLCEHPDLAHHFEISNKHNFNSLLVGSSCILKFEEIEVRDVLGGVASDQKERRFYLQEALREKLRQRMVEPLRTLWKVDIRNREAVERYARTLKSGGGISPSSLLFLFRRMENCGIPFRAKLYKVSLRAVHEIGELSRMTRAELLMLRPCLSSAQRKRFSHLFSRETIN